MQPSATGGRRTNMSVERLELSTNGLKGQINKSMIDNKETIVLSQSVGSLERKALCWVY